MADASVVIVVVSGGGGEAHSVQPLRFTEPSLLHFNMVPAGATTSCGPLLPEYLRARSVVTSRTKSHPSSVLKVVAEMLIRCTTSAMQSWLLRYLLPGPDPSDIQRPDADTVQLPLTMRQYVSL